MKKLKSNIYCLFFAYMLNLAAAPLLFSIENELILVCWRGGYDDDDDGLMKQCFWYVCALYV